MTRLQNAKNQLIEALAELESAAAHVNALSNKTDAAMGPFQMSAQPVEGAELSALVEEVSIIESKLSQAMTMIASVEPVGARPRTVAVGDTE